MMSIIGTNSGLAVCPVATYSRSIQYTRKQLQKEVKKHLYDQVSIYSTTNKYKPNFSYNHLAKVIHIMQ
jgi:hypothetical protein